MASQVIRRAQQIIEPCLIHIIFFTQSLYGNRFIVYKKVGDNGRDRFIVWDVINVHDQIAGGHFVVSHLDRITFVSFYKIFMVINFIFCHFDKLSQSLDAN